MKIGEFWKLESVEGSAETQKKGAAKSDTDFAALLQDELSGAEKTGSGEGVSELNPTASVAGISGIECDKETAGAIEEVDRIIAMLQSMEESLKTDASPKQVDQIIKKLATAADKLQARMEGISGNQGLHDLAQEVNVATLMESVKWRRGDYL